jgi:outer membrane protein insertion porin family
MTGRCVHTGRGAQRKALGVLGLLLLLGVAPPETTAQMSGNIPDGAIIADISVQGCHDITPDKVLNMIKTRAGRKLSNSILRDDIRTLAPRLFRHCWWDKNLLPDGRVSLVLRVIEFPGKVQDVIFKNDNHIPKKDLEQLTAGIRKGLPLNPAANRQARIEIEQFLKNQGRYWAHVDLVEGGKSGDKRVVFNITEGPVVKIRSINFTGNQELATSARLKTQVNSKPPLLGLIGGKYVPEMINADVDQLIKYYRDNGYLDVRVTREISFSEDNRYVDLNFHIHEGQRYQVQSVSIVQDHKRMNPSEVYTLPEVKRGDYYSRGKIEADKQKITNYYGWRGYQVAVKDEFTGDKGLVNVVYQIEEKPPARVGQIHIVGNDVTQDRVIRRVLGLYPGQVLRYPELRIAEMDLQRLNIFKVDPENGIKPTLRVLQTENSDVQDILVEVQEAPTGMLMFGAGVNSNAANGGAGLVGSIVLNERNFNLFRLPTSWADVMEGRAFRGAGQELRIEAVPGTQLQRYMITWREPYLFDRPYNLTVSGYYYSRLFNEYTETREGGRFTLGHQFNRYWSVLGSFRIENVNVSNLGFGPPVDYTSVLGNNFLYAPALQAIYDTRDSYLRPTQGGVLDMGYEQGLGKFTFPKFNVEGTRYFYTYERPDGSGRHVVALRSQFNWAGPDTPVYERYYAGGINSLRGFMWGSVGPHVNAFNVRGDFMWLNSIEYQVPVKANDSIYLVGFVDSGTVERTMEIKDYRVSAGFGVRLSIPMMGPVPIALDFGFPIVRGPGDRVQTFNFYVGFFR